VDGSIQVSANDLSSSGLAGNPWGQSRTWINGPNFASVTAEGMGWVDTQLPWIQQANSGNTLVMVSSGSNSLFWDLVGSTWSPRYFLQDTLVDNSSTHQYVVTDDTGKVLIFQDFSTGVPSAQRGEFQSETDQFGNTTSVISHNSNGAIQEIQSSSTV